MRAIREPMRAQRLASNRSSVGSRARREATRERIGAVAWMVAVRQLALPEPRCVATFVEKGDADYTHIARGTVFASAIRLAGCAETKGCDLPLAGTPAVNLELTVGANQVPPLGKAATAAVDDVETVDRHNHLDASGTVVSQDDAVTASPAPWI